MQLKQVQLCAGNGLDLNRLVFFLIPAIFFPSDRCNTVLFFLGTVSDKLLDL